MVIMEESTDELTSIIGRSAVNAAGVNNKKNDSNKKDFTVYNRILLFNLILINLYFIRFHQIIQQCIVCLNLPLGIDILRNLLVDFL